ncbi:MAG: hypothetical protein U0694_23385 [Anaerolineae bacterium]
MTETKQEEFRRLEDCTAELMIAFEITAPPVPIETMLQNPLPNMWDQVDATQLSGTFLSIKTQYSPRMSLARLLTRHVAASPWGKEHNLTYMLKDDELLRVFARMLLMPSPMVKNLTSGARNPTTMSMHFEVPEDDARLRLQELALYS